MKESAVVLLSGGQDSATCLFWAKKRFKKVRAVSFDYGQRHLNELKSAGKIAALSDTPHNVLPVMEYKSIGNSALLDRSQKLLAKHPKDSSLPATFVPGRNLLFLAAAASFAYSLGIRDIVIGVSQADYSGYPDCREGFIKSAQKSLSLALGTKVRIHTPLINLDKRDTVLLAKKMGILGVLKHTTTCYSGLKKACGKCPACLLRSKGFKEAGLKDPLLKRKSK